MLEHPAGDRSLTPSQVDHVAQVCQDFEAAWKGALAGGERPRIEHYLKGAPEAARRVLLGTFWKWKWPTGANWANRRPSKSTACAFPNISRK
jgi:hypothetical protein